MRALLDVNVLLSLLDEEHSHHRRALEWFNAHAELGWASCPLTQNGCMRILSQPKYLHPKPLGEIEQRLGEFTAHRVHEFWPDDISLLDSSRFDLHYSQGSGQLTDLYLLALAVRNGGRLVTFDRRISLRAAHGAGKENLVLV